jgi:methyl-accepting chemotaxis protein
MGMLEGVAGVFGLSGRDDRKIDRVQEEINFMDAINAHVKCKVHLQNYIDGKLQEQLDPAVVSRDDHCVLGKWIHGPAFRSFPMSPSFYQLRTQHAQMHHIAGNVIMHVHANDRAAAKALMESTYKEASRKVVKALTELNQSVKA